MSPTIRIDNEVWAWLQQQARPFEDTPNSVLRRVAGLDGGNGRGTSREGGRKMSVTTGRLGIRVTGELQNRKHGLSAKHALYHKDGTFYERLREFPGVLCDDRGYVKYESREQFEKDARLNIGLKVNVPGTLASHPRYKLFAKD